MHTNAFRVNCKTGMRAGAARINLREACSAPGAVRAQALAAAGCSGFVRICRRAAKPPRASRTRLRACVGGERHARAQCKTGHRRWRGEPCAAHPSSVARVAAACVRGQAPRTDVPPQTLTVLWPQRRRACRVRGVRSSVRRPPCCARIRSDSQDSALAPGICWRMRVPSACPPHQAGPPRAVRGAARRDLEHWTEVEGQKRGVPPARKALERGSISVVH